MLTYFKAYYKSILDISKWNRIDSPKIDLPIYGSYFYLSCPRYTIWKRALKKKSICLV